MGANEVSFPLTILLIDEWVRCSGGGSDLLMDGDVVGPHWLRSLGLHGGQEPLVTKL